MARKRLGAASRLTCCSPELSDGLRARGWEDTGGGEAAGKELGALLVEIEQGHGLGLQEGGGCGTGLLEMVAGGGQLPVEEGGCGAAGDWIDGG